MPGRPGALPRDTEVASVRPLRHVRERLLSRSCALFNIVAKGVLPPLASRKTSAQQIDGPSSGGYGYSTEALAQDDSPDVALAAAEHEVAPVQEVCLTHPGLDVGDLGVVQVSAALLDGAAGR